MKKDQLVAELKLEIARVGAADAYGESGGLAVWIEDDGTVKIGDEEYQLTATPQHLQALRELPDDAGWEAAWDVLN